MSLFDRLPRGECPYCRKSYVLKKTPDGEELIWEHLAESYNDYSSLCPGSYRPPAEGSVKRP
jgi:hypothetical protein